MMALDLDQIKILFKIETRLGDVQYKYIEQLFDQQMVYQLLYIRFYRNSHAVVGKYFVVHPVLLFIDNDIFRFQNSSHQPYTSKNILQIMIISLLIILKKNANIHLNTPYTIS